MKNPVDRGDRALQAAKFAMTNPELVLASGELLAAARHALDVAESWIRPALAGSDGLGEELARLDSVRRAISKATRS